MPKVSEEYFENKKKEIIDAAYQVCLEKPLMSVVLQDITDKAGFSHGTIYKYYKNVDEILYEMFARFNTEYNIEERWEAILDSAADWKEVIRKSCALLKDIITNAELGKLKLSEYTNTMSMSNPERAMVFYSKLQNSGRSPFYDLEDYLHEYLTKVVQEESLHPTRSLDSILQFMFVSVNGFKTRHTISKCFQRKDRYDPDEIFSCLADSIVILIGGTKE